MRRHASEELVGVMQHYRYRDGTRRLRMARRTHSLMDELPEPRPTIEPIITSWTEAVKILGLSVAFLVILGGVIGGLYLWAVVANPAVLG